MPLPCQCPCPTSFFCAAGELGPGPGGRSWGGMAWSYVCPLKCSCQQPFPCSFFCAAGELGPGPGGRSGAGWRGPGGRGLPGSRCVSKATNSPTVFPTLASAPSQLTFLCFPPLSFPHVWCISFPFPFCCILSFPFCTRIKLCFESLCLVCSLAGAPILLRGDPPAAGAKRVGQCQLSRTSSRLARAPWTWWGACCRAWSGARREQVRSAATRFITLVLLWVWPCLFILPTFPEASKGVSSFCQLP